MNKRMAVLLVVGAISVAAFAVGSRYAPMKTVAQLNAEAKAEQEIKLAKERDENTKRTIHSLQKAMVSGATEEKRRYAGLEYRMLKEMHDGRKIVDIFQSKDGIDQFEALLLAKVYFMGDFGFCGSVGLPTRKGNEWIIPISVGRESGSASPIIIDALTGSLRCEGHPSISDASIFLRDYEAAGTFYGSGPTKS